MKAAEFAKSNKCDYDWVVAMGDSEVSVLSAGQKGKTSGFDATVLRHYRNSMYEVRTAGGVSCISSSDFMQDN